MYFDCIQSSPELHVIGEKTFLSCTFPFFKDHSYVQLTMSSVTSYYPILSILNNYVSTSCKVSQRTWLDRNDNYMDILPSIIENIF